MKNIFFIILLISTSISTEAQSSLKSLSESFCKSLKKNDLERPENSLDEYFEYIMDSVCRTNYKKYKKLKLYVKNRNKKLQAYTIHKKSQKNIFLSASKKCTILKEINKKHSLSKQSVRNVANQLCDLLNETDKKYITVDKIINEKINELIIENKQLIIKEYKNINSIKYRNDLNEKLFNNCDIYYKWFLGQY